MGEEKRKKREGRERWKRGIGGRKGGGEERKTRRRCSRKRKMRDAGGEIRKNGEEEGKEGKVE